MFSMNRTLYSNSLFFSPSLYSHSHSHSHILSFLKLLIIIVQPVSSLLLLSTPPKPPPFLPMPSSLSNAFPSALSPRLAATTLASWHRMASKRWRSCSGDCRATTSTASTTRRRWRRRSRKTAESSSRVWRERESVCVWRFCDRQRELAF